MSLKRSTIQSYRKKIDEKKVRRDLLRTAKKRFSRELSDLNQDREALEEAREIFKKSAILTQNHLAEHLSSIVTKSLRLVWPESDLSFHAEFVERRNSTECDMWIEEKGFKYSLLDGKGYGVVDIVSFSLKVAYILLHTVDNVVIIDEPFRNLGRNKHEITSHLLKELSDELEMQFIIATHSHSIIKHADVAFHIEKGKVKND